MCVFEARDDAASAACGADAAGADAVTAATVVILVMELNDEAVTGSTGESFEEREPIKTEREGRQEEGKRERGKRRGRKESGRESKQKERERENRERAKKREGECEREKGRGGVRKDRTVNKRRAGN